MGPLPALPDGCNFKVLTSLGSPAAGEGLPAPEAGVGSPLRGAEKKVRGRGALCWAGEQGESFVETS